MLKAKQPQEKSQQFDTYSTQEIVITKPLTLIPICVSNISPKNKEKSQTAPKKTPQ